MLLPHRRVGEVLGKHPFGRARACRQGRIFDGGGL
jgi:hypothetical protein